MVLPVLQSHAFEHLRGPPPGFPLGKVIGRVGKRHRRVVQSAGARQQVEALEDKSDLAVSHQGSVIGGEPGHLIAFEPVLPGRGPIEAPQEMHQGALTRAGCAHQGDELSPRHREGNPLQHGNGNLAHLIGLMDVVQFDKLHESLYLMEIV